MKTMSLTKIFLALIVSIPTLSLNCTGSLTVAMPMPMHTQSLWKRFGTGTQAFFSKTQECLAPALAKVKSAFKAGANKVQELVKNNKTAAKVVGGVVVTTALGAAIYKWLQVRELNGLKKKFANKDDQEAREARIARKASLEARELEAAKADPIRQQLIASKQAKEAAERAAVEAADKAKKDADAKEKAAREADKRKLL